MKLEDIVNVDMKMDSCAPDITWSVSGDLILEYSHYYRSQGRRVINPFTAMIISNRRLVHQARKLTAVADTYDNQGRKFALESEIRGQIFGRGEE